MAWLAVDKNGGVQGNVAISSLTENTSYLEIKRSSV